MKVSFLKYIEILVSFEIAMSEIDVFQQLNEPQSVQIHNLVDRGLVPRPSY